MLDAYHHTIHPSCTNYACTYSDKLPYLGQSNLSLRAAYIRSCSKGLHFMALGFTRTPILQKEKETFCDIKTIWNLVTEKKSYNKNNVNKHLISVIFFSLTTLIFNRRSVMLFVESLASSKLVFKYFSSILFEWFNQPSNRPG